MKRALAGFALAAVLLAQVPTPAVVSLPPGEEKAITTAIADFYKTETNYRQRLDALQAERARALSAAKGKVDAAQHELEVKYNCNYDLDAFLCYEIKSPEK